jgi:hypothetical protein
MKLKTANEFSKQACCHRDVPHQLIVYNPQCANNENFSK